MSNTHANKHQHLNMIQAVINRMANNSFLLKSWSIVVVSALFAIASEKTITYFAGLALLPIIAFWILDGYFLWQERLYRELYNAVTQKEDDAIDYSLNASQFTCDGYSWCKACCSKTLVIFYGLLLVMVAGLFVISYCFL